MPIEIGQQPDSGFDQPMNLLSDCHRRIERFLGAMLSVTRNRRGGELDDRSREALEKALRYFSAAAPHHTEDEENSLFPRLRRLDAPEVREAFAQMDRLEADHRTAEARHAEVEKLAASWLRTGHLAPDRTERLLALLEQLQAGYAEHIALEDEQLFPLAAKLLSEDELRQIGREMAARRGVEHDEACGGQ